MKSISDHPIAAGTNRDFSHTLPCSNPARIWHYWTQPSSWKDWDGGLIGAETPGDRLQAGSRGTLQPKKGRKSHFRIVEYQEGQSITFETKLPFAFLSVSRSLRQTPEGCQFTHRVYFHGLWGGFWANRFGPGFREELPRTMLRLQDLSRTAR